MKKLSCYLLLLCFFGISATGSTESEYLGDMMVANCTEWVSLRVEPDKSADRLIKVPLGAIVTNCCRHTDEYMYAEYNGLCGFILSHYLEKIDESTAKDDDWLARCRDKIRLTESSFGAALLSTSTGGDWLMLDEKKHLQSVLNGMPDEWQQTLSAISDERIVEIRGGQELYLIIPMDKDASVAVRQRTPSEDGSPGDIVSTIYRDHSGKPFLLRCNVAVMPWDTNAYLPSWITSLVPYDCEIIIAASDGTEFTWYPHMNFYSGELDTVIVNGQIYDFTDYESLRNTQIQEAN